MNSPHTHLLSLEELVIRLSKQDAKCNGEGGLITLAAEGGVDPYTFTNQDTGSTYSAGNLTGVQVGTYYFFATDSFACNSVGDYVTVTEPGKYICSLLLPFLSALLSALFSLLLFHLTFTCRATGTQCKLHKYFLSWC